MCREENNILEKIWIVDQRKTWPRSVCRSEDAVTVAFIKHTTKYYSGNSLNTAQTQSVDIACMSWYWWTFFMTLYFRLGDSRKLFFNNIIFTVSGKMCFFHVVECWWNSSVSEQRCACTLFWGNLFFLTILSPLGALLHDSLWIVKQWLWSQRQNRLVFPDEELVLNKSGASWVNIHCDLILI